MTRQPPSLEPHVSSFCATCFVVSVDVGAHLAGVGGDPVLAGLEWPVLADPAGNVANGAAGVRADIAAALPGGGCGGGVVGRGNRLRGEFVRFSWPPFFCLGPAATTRHAGICGGLCIHRLFAVRRAAAKLVADQLWPAGPAPARDTQPRWRHPGLHGDSLPLCLSAGADRAVRARCSFDGSGPPAGCAAGAAHSRSRPAAGPAGCGCRRRAGFDGDAGRLWRIQLLWRSDFHCGHLQGLAGDGQPHGGCATGHRLVAGGGCPAKDRATRAKADAFCKRPGRPCRL